MKSGKYSNISGENEALSRKIDILEKEISQLKRKLQYQERQNQILQYRLDLNELFLIEPFHNIISAVIDSAEKLTDSKIGFLHFYNEEKKTLELQTWSTNTLTRFCRAHPKEEHYSLDFAGVWTDCIKLRRPVIHNDYSTLPHKKGVPEGHAHIIRQLTVPIIRDGVIVGVLGVGNKETDYTEEDIEDLTKFSDVTWEIIIMAEIRKQNENRYHTVIETSLEGFMIVGPDGYVKEVNSTYVRMSGYSREEILSMHITEFDACETHQATMEHAKRIAARGSEVFETVHRKKDGSLWHAEISITFLDIDGGLFYIFLKNITRRKESEELMRTTIKLLSLINSTNGIPDLITRSCSIFREYSGCEAVAIRYKDEDDFAESICGNILHSRKNPVVPFLTEYGSFWTNSASALLLNTNEDESNYIIPYNCNVEGSESVALIPLKIGQETFGHLQLSDKRKGMFDLNKIQIFERLSAYISGTLSHFENRNLLINSENRHRKISSLISNVAYSCRKTDGKCQFDWIAGSIEKTFGFTTGELIQSGCWGKLVIEEDQPVFRSNVAELQPGCRSNCELRIRTKDGTIKWINSLTESVHSGANKEEIRLYGGIIDITESKIVEEERKKFREDLEHSRDLMSYVIEHNRGAVAVHDRDMRYIYVSQRYLTDFGIKEKDIIGKHHYEVFPDLPQKWRAAHQEALRGNILKKDDDIFEREDGSVDWTRWECRPWYFSDRTIGGIVVYTEVITERKKVELALKNSEMQLNTLFNSAPVIMILIDQENRILKMNKFGLESTGRNIENLTGLKPGDVLRCINSYKKPEGCGGSKECQTCTMRNIVTETFLTGTEHYKKEAELTSSKSGKKTHTILVSTSIISTTPEKQVLVTIDDITERKEMEKELIKARDRAEESDNLKSAFLANISHEFRTPMNGIMGFSDMLSKPNLSDEKRNQFTSFIQDGCRQLLGVIDDVIQISMIDTDQLRVNKTNFSLNEFMQEIFLMFRSPTKSKNLNLFYKTPDRKLEINTDREKLKHVFSNLVSNALKFTKEGHIEFGCTLVKNNIEFYIKDTGIGIRKELHKAVFERFRQAETSDTRNYSGTGLGLSISRGLVKLLGGDIRIESEPGRGTTFLFLIPEVIARTIEECNDSSPEDIQNRNEILIAEDDEINFLFLQEVLEEMNCFPLHACNGSEAIELLRENPSVKLILMDIKMPVMDGYEATREIRKFNDTIPIIAQTAFSYTGTKADLIRSGFNDTITKPIDRTKLESLLNQYVQT